MNNFENPSLDAEPPKEEAPQPEVEKKIDRPGFLRRTAQAAVAAVMMTAAAEGAELPKESSLKPGVRAESSDAASESRRELFGILREVSGGQMKTNEQGCVVRMSGSLSLNGKAIANPSGYFLLDKPALEKMTAVVKTDLVEQKFGDFKFDRTTRRMVMMRIQKMIAEYGKAIPVGDKMLSGLFSPEAAADLNRQLRGNDSPMERKQDPGIKKERETKPDDRPKPRSWTSPSLKDYLTDTKPADKIAPEKKTNPDIDEFLR